MVLMETQPQPVNKERELTGTQKTSHKLNNKDPVNRLWKLSLQGAQTPPEVQLLFQSSSSSCHRKGRNAKWLVSLPL